LVLLSVLFSAQLAFFLIKKEGKEGITMFKPVRIACLVLGVLFLVGLVSTRTGEAQVKKDKLTVGMVVPLTGDNAAYGVSHKSGLELAFDEINKMGGVKGREIEIVAHDDMGDPKQAATGAQKFVDQKRVLVITGSSLSSSTLAMVPITDKAKLTHTVVGSSTPKLSGISKYFFRMAVQDTDMGITVADVLAEKLKVKKVAILYPNNDYGKGLMAAVEGRLREHRVTLVSNQTYFTTDKDFLALLTGIKAAEVDALVLLGQYTDSGLITKQAREIGFDKLIVGANGLYKPQYIEIAGKASEGVYLTSAFVADNPDPRVQQFVRKYKEKYGMEPDMFAALGYDQGYVLKEAMEKAAEKGPISRGNIRDAMAATHYKGITGTVTFNDKGDWVRSYLTVIVKNGRFFLLQ
jgi:branched-chain amino acid transport system substrate-binding protein